MSKKLSHFAINWIILSFFQISTKDVSFCTLLESSIKASHYHTSELQQHGSWLNHDYWTFWPPVNGPCLWFKETWMAFADATAESPLLTIFSSSPTFSDSCSAFTLVDWINLFAVSRAEHSYQNKSKEKKIIFSRKQPSKGMLNAKQQMLCQPYEDERFLQWLSLLYKKAQTETAPDKKQKPTCSWQISTIK